MLLIYCLDLESRIKRHKKLNMVNVRRHYVEFMGSKNLLLFYCPISTNEVSLDSSWSREYPKAVWRHNMADAKPHDGKFVVSETFIYSVSTLILIHQNDPAIFSVLREHRNTHAQMAAKNISLLLGSVTLK